MQRHRVLMTSVLTTGVLLLAFAGVTTPAGPEAAASAVSAEPWPGDQSVQPADVQAELGTDISGLSYRVGPTRDSDVLWAVDNREPLIHRLVQRGGAWRPDTSNGWSRGKRFAFPDGQRADAEGLVITNGVAWVATERVFDGASRTSILRVPLSGSTSTLGRTREWKLAKEFPHIGSNIGLEALDFVPDSFLVAHEFRDQSRGRRYDPADYPRKVAGGVFFTAAEATSLNGEVRGYVLNDNGTFVRVATISNPMGLVMALDFDAHAETLWLACDDDCNGRYAAAKIRNGRFVVTAVHARPTGLGNYNHEGFATTPGSRCAHGRRPVYWANDANNGGHAIRQGTLPCRAPAPSPRATADLTVTAPTGRTGTVRKVRVRVRSAADVAPGGSVTVEVARRSRTARVQQGLAVVRIGRFSRPGRRTVKVTYTGDTRTAPGTGRATLRIRKTAPRLVPARSILRVQRGQRARVVTRVRANGLAVRPRVGVRVDGTLVRAHVRRTERRIVVRTPVLRRFGQRTVVVRLAATPKTRSARAEVRVRVR